MLSKIQCDITKIGIQRIKLSTRKSIKSFITIFYAKNENYGWYVNSIPKEKYRVRCYA